MRGPRLSLRGLLSRKPDRNRASHAGNLKSLTTCKHGTQELTRNHCAAGELKLPGDSECRVLLLSTKQHQTSKLNWVPLRNGVCVYKRIVNNIARWRG